MGYGVFVIVLGGVLLAVALVHRWWPEVGNDNVHRSAGSIRTSDPKISIGRPRSELAESARSLETVGASSSIPAVTAAISPSTEPACHPLDDEDSSKVCHLMDDMTGRAGWAAAGVVLLAVAEMFFLQRLAQMPPRGRVGVVLAADGLNPIELPSFLGTEWIGRRAEVSAVEREMLPPDTGFSRKNYANVADRTRDVFLSIVLSGRDRTSIHRPELCLVGQGWTIEGGGQQTFRFPADSGRGNEFRATVLRVRREVPSLRGKIVVPQLVAYWFVAGDTVVPSHWQRFVHDTWNRVARARVDRWAYVLMQTDARDGEAAAMARMQTVLDGTLPVFQRVRQGGELSAAPSSQD
jgi:hypothetical protein